jgi:hypothetical protein
VRIHPLALLALASASVFANLVADVRTALSHDDFSRASDLIRGYRAANGVTPEMLEALSWVARGDLGMKRFDDAEKAADETYRLAVAETKRRRLDRDPSLAPARRRTISAARPSPTFATSSRCFTRLPFARAFRRISTC